MTAALSRRGTMLAARKLTPAAVALRAAMKRSGAGGGRFPVSPAIERTVDGTVFASKSEAARYALLKLRERIGEIQDLWLQPSFSVEIAGKPFCRYTADFFYVDVRSNQHVIEEVKTGGTRKDAAYRLRRKAAEMAYGITVTEIVA